MKQSAVADTNAEEEEEAALRISVECGRAVVGCGLMGRLSGPFLREEYGSDVRRGGYKGTGGSTG